MAAPLVVALLSLKRGQRAALVFCLAGMGACLLSAYLNTFFARLYQADAVNAATQIAPGGRLSSSPTLSRCPRRCASGCWRGKPRRKYSLIGPSCWTV